MKNTLVCLTALIGVFTAGSLSAFDRDGAALDFGQNSSFIEPEQYTIKNDTICPKFGTYSAVISDRRGRVGFVSISSPKHRGKKTEIGEINEFLSSFVGMEPSLSISCDPRGVGYFSVYLFPRDTSKGTIKQVDIEWNADSYKIIGDSSPVVPKQ